MQFRGYIDEGFDPKQQKVFALSCILARGVAWNEFERKWKLQLEAKNRALRKEGRKPISRYHASDCSGRRKEFKDWTHDERDDFVLGLFQIFRQIKTFTVVYDVLMDDVCAVFPEYAKDRLTAIYFWMTTFMIIQIGKDFNWKPRKGKENHFTLFHDRTGGKANAGEYDATILQAFNRLKNDRTFSHRDKFNTISPLGWEACIALQAADLVAFECYKQAEARLEARKSRKSFDALLDMRTFGIHSKTITLEALQNLRKIVEAARKKQHISSDDIWKG